MVSESYGKAANIGEKKMKLSCPEVNRGTNEDENLS